MDTMELLVKLWPLTLTCIGVVFAMGKLYQKFVQHDQILRKVIDADKIVRGYLFNQKTGDQIYTSRSMCSNLHTPILTMLTKMDANIQSMGKSISWIEGKMEKNNDR